VIRLLLSLYPSGIISRPLQVIGIIRSEQSSLIALADCLADPQFSIRFLDLARSNDINLGSPDYVLHAASHASPKYYSVDPIGILLANSLGTYDLLNASRGSKRFLFVSSSEVYGITSTEKAISESDFGQLDPTVLRSCYSEAKRFGESLSACWHKMHGLHTNIVRPFHTYGPGLRCDDGRVFADFAYAVAHRKPITLTSSGSAIRAYCYVSDAVAGIMTVLLCGAAGEAYNLANPNAVISVKDLAEMLSSTYGIPVNASDPAPGYLASTFNALIPNIDKLGSLGWTPHVNVAEGFDRFIRAVSA
jgi:UDP-glucuronate decarboxylase